MVEKKNSPERRLSMTIEVLRQNAILNGVTPETAESILSRGTLVELSLRQEIYQSEQTIEAVYFPIDAVLSIVAQMKDGSEIEVGTIGREGMSAFPLLMGATSTANYCYCQVRGKAIKIDTDLFHKMMEDDYKFRQLLDRYLQSYVNMLGQLAACNRLHSIYERCSRWLLMTHDRVKSDKIPLTQEFLAMMLGTGRSGVSIAAATLQQAGFIKNSHGIIDILDRAGLESAACECYEVAYKQFSGLLRPLPVIQAENIKSLAARRSRIDDDLNL